MDTGKYRQFKDAVMTAVNLGDDTDTVGAVTGALASIITVMMQFLQNG